MSAAASPSPRAFRPSRRPSLLVLGCLLVVAAIATCAATGTLLAPQDPGKQTLLTGVQAPSGAHLLGTDDAGRDILSRVIAGARAALAGPLLVVAGAALIGIAFGIAAGYRGGWLDALVMRCVDMMYALPSLLVAIALIGVMGGGYYAAVGLLVVLTAPVDLRIIRGATLEQRALPYVEAARTVGLPQRTIMFRHILPNVAPLIVANSFLNFAYSLVTLSALSFLGLGAGPAEADWGRMLSDNLQLIDANPVAALAPGAMLVLLATSMNLLGDRCYERIFDRGRR